LAAELTTFGNGSGLRARLSLEVFILRRLLQEEEVVAGAGFEPAAFRL
jgi:hypothetical protein